MDTRAEDLLVAVIDEALGRSARVGSLTPTRELVDVLLDLRIVVGEIASLDRLLAARATTANPPPAVVR